MQFKSDQTAQKLRGGYYTPLDLAVFVSQWVIGNNSSADILEPSCGDGAFLEALDITAKKGTNVYAFEIEKEEAKKATLRAEGFRKTVTTVANKDFLSWFLSGDSENKKFDGVVGNPPFIRYQFLPAGAQELAEQIFLKYGLPFTRHTNAWVPFIIASLELLKPGGRLGMIIPAEILHVMHAQSLRTYLGINCEKLLIFDPEDMWFENTLQGVVILLAQKKSTTADTSQGLGIIRTYGRDFLKTLPESYFGSTNFINGKTVEGKWTRALLTKNELETFEAAFNTNRVFKFKDVASVDVGMVTGANDFFLVSNQVVKDYRLENWVYPMFGRSQHCPGVIYDEAQHLSNSEKGFPTNFVWFNVADATKLGKKALEYIKLGEDQELHKRYKCRIREPWYKVPYVYHSKIGMLKRAHDIPRLILNELNAYTTDTAYRISTKSINEESFVSCFINSLTALSAELEGRSYGGGVLELVPSEIEKLLIPIPTKHKPSLKKLDRLVRTSSAEDVLEHQDRQILEAVGLSKNEREIIKESWNRLRNRRQRITPE
jgi:adenine-specific DNA-methyltransferase